MTTKLPGLIDVHVHLREPGAEHKEDFYTGSRAAIKGGFTYILDMPNNVVPTVDIDRLNEKIILSERGICDIGFHFGTNGKNVGYFQEAWESPKVFGLKVYCNHTTGEMLIEDKQLIESVFKNWHSEKPVLVHAEGIQLAIAIGLARVYDRRLHVCHISQAAEVDWVRQAKKEGLKVTAGVTPHHLFLIDKDVNRLGSYGIMKPPLGTDKDREALWQGIDDQTIDVVETDHAPHTIEEKEKEIPPFGVTGLETALGLMGWAMKNNRISAENVIRLMYDNPRKIFNIPKQPDTYIEVDFDKEFVAGASGYETKCGWSPFHGWNLWGKIERVVFYGREIFDGKEIIENQQVLNI